MTLSHTVPSEKDGRVKPHRAASPLPVAANCQSADWKDQREKLEILQKTQTVVEWKQTEDPPTPVISTVTHFSRIHRSW